VDRGRAAAAGDSAPFGPAARPGVRRIM
jgi:hypothetical protein